MYMCTFDWQVYKVVSVAYKGRKLFLQSRYTEQDKKESCRIKKYRVVIKVLRADSRRLILVLWSTTLRRTQKPDASELYTLTGRLSERARAKLSYRKSYDARLTPKRRLWTSHSPLATTLTRSFVLAVLLRLQT